MGGEKTYACAFPTCSLCTSNLSFLVVACCLSVSPIFELWEEEKWCAVERGEIEEVLGWITVRERTVIWRMKVRNSEEDILIMDGRGLVRVYMVYTRLAYWEEGRRLRLRMRIQLGLLMGLDFGG